MKHRQHKPDSPAQSTAQCRLAQNTGFVIHVVPRRADGIVLVKGETSPCSCDLGAGVVRETCIE